MPIGDVAILTIGFRSLRLAGDGERLGIYGFGAAAHTVSQGQTDRLGRRRYRQRAAVRAADLGVDLLVMGAYTHSRVRELIVGGTTRTVLDSITLPTLMAH